MGNQGFKSQFEQIFNCKMSQEQINYLWKKKIYNLNDFCKSYDIEQLENQSQKNIFRVILLLYRLELQIEEFESLVQKALQLGIDHIKKFEKIDDAKFQQLNLNQEQQKIIFEQINQLQQEDLFQYFIKYIIFDYKVQNMQMNNLKDMDQQELQSLNKNQSKLQDLKHQFQLIYTLYYSEKMENIFSEDQIYQQWDNLLKKAVLKKNSKGVSFLKYPIFKKEEITDIELYQSMMVIGQTGSGKTTFLNFFINYYLEIQQQHNFRFILIEEPEEISQAVSQTQKVNIYYIKPFKGKTGIILIDTPGFGDTRGIKQDQIVINQIENCFKSDVNFLSTICFVIQSSNARLTTTQSYILNSLLQMFGKDIIKNFVFMLTFCDGGDPKAIDALKFQGDQNHIASPVAQMICQIEEPWYLKLNSSAYMIQEEDQVARYFWDMAMKSFDEFYRKKLIKNNSQSLTLTQEVIKERENLKLVIEELRREIEQKLVLIQSSKEVQQQIEDCIKRSNSFAKSKIKVKNPKIQKIELNQGEYTTNCINCNHTCHYLCQIPDDNNKMKCQAMKNEICTICENKCKWDQHKNMKFWFKTEIIEEEIEMKEFKKQFLDANSKRSEQEQVLDGNEKKLIQLETSCMEKSQKLMLSVNKLKNIALQPACCKTQKEYIDIMIQEEILNKRDYYLDRIKELEELKNNWKLIEEICDKQENQQVDNQLIEQVIRNKKSVIKVKQTEY